MAVVITQERRSFVAMRPIYAPTTVLVMAAVGSQAERPGVVPPARLAAPSGMAPIMAGTAGTGMEAPGTVGMVTAPGMAPGIGAVVTRFTSQVGISAGISEEGISVASGT